MADEIRTIADQRLDLIDLTRWKSFIQEMMGNAFGDILGNPENYTGAARNTLARPNIICNFYCVAGPGLLDITIGQSYAAGADVYTALVYDKDGNRLTGPNSVDPKVFTVTDIAVIGVDRYLIARRLQNDAVTESRKHYSAVAGEYSASIDTVTYDDWEVSESLDEIALNVSAASNVVLRDAGWIDIATFRIDAVPSITVVTNNVQSALVAEPLSWAGAPPAIDRVPMNLFEVIASIAQIMRRMRWGTGGTARNWHDDPANDAVLEEGGGLRFNNGAGALLDLYWRPMAATFNQITSVINGAINANDLRHIRGKAVIAGDLTSGGAPNVATPSGFIYSDDLDGVASPVDVQKIWSCDAIEMIPGLDETTITGPAPAASHDPWNYYTATGGQTNCWYIDNTLVGPPSLVPFRWRHNATAIALGLYGQNLLFIPIKLPPGCLLYRVEVRMRQLANMNANHWIILDVYSRDCDTVTLLSSNVPGQQWIAGAPADRTLTTPVGWAGNVIDGALSYFATIRWSSVGGAGGFGPEDCYAIGQARFYAYIREASHVY